MKIYEINTNNVESALDFTVKHDNCAVIFKNVDFKNKNFVIVAEEVR